MKSGRYIGVMSGTSLDGIDVVLAAIDDRMVAQQASYSHPMPIALKKEILGMCQGQQTTLAAVGRLDAQLGTLFGEAVLGLLKQTGIDADHITAIGCHGQTVWHEPECDARFSVQLGDNNRIAALTNITTVGDFRRRDMAYGGQGAPLLPAFPRRAAYGAEHRRHRQPLSAVARCAGARFRHRAGQHADGRLDLAPPRATLRSGRRLGYAGGVCLPLLQQMLADPYFALPAPKSTSREYFNIAWLERQLAGLPAIAPVDVQATLTELTAVSISEQVQLAGGCERLLVCGGGARNTLLMARLSALLPGTEVGLTDDCGVSGDDMEALAFAWLAFRTLSGQAGNLPSVTGASRETVLGGIYPVLPFGGR